MRCRVRFGTGWIRYYPTLRICSRSSYRRADLQNGRWNFAIKTEPGAAPPNRPPYRLSPKEHEELQAQIEDLLAQGHIRPSQSPYGTQIPFVPKKDGRWCMCIDYRALNKQTIKDRYPLLRIDDLLDRLGKAKYFSTIDLASGYHQIAMKEGRHSEDRLPYASGPL